MHAINKNSLFLHINRNETFVNIPEIPTFSATTLALFSTLFPSLGVKSANCLHCSLKEKAQTLAGAIQKMQDAKEHVTKNKIYAVLRTVVAMAFATGAVFGLTKWVAFLAAASLAPQVLVPAAIGTAFVTLVAIAAYTALGMYNADAAGIKTMKLGYAGGLACWIGAPLFPLYEIYSQIFEAPGKISILEGDILKRKQEIESNFRELVTFFTSHYNETRHTLREKIQQCEQSLLSLTQFPITTPAWQKEIEERKKNYETALEELEKASAYYTSF